MHVPEDDTATDERLLKSYPADAMGLAFLVLVVFPRLLTEPDYASLWMPEEIRPLVYAIRDGEAPVDARESAHVATRKWARVLGEYR